MPLSSNESPSLDKTFDDDSDLFMGHDHLYEPNNNGLQSVDDVEASQPITYVASSDFIASMMSRVSFAVDAAQSKFTDNFIEPDEVLAANLQFSNGMQLFIQDSHQDCNSSTISDHLKLLWEPPSHQATQPVTSRWQNFLNDVQSNDNGDTIHSGKQR